MHEFAIAQSLVEAVCEEAQRAGASHVNRAHVRVGVLRMLDARLIQEAWVIACDGTLCQGGQLTVEACPTRVECLTCGNVEPIAEWRERCSSCGAVGGRVRGGDELELTKLDVVLEGGVPASSGAGTEM
jgi:hydrogenase nickel incorporation protein HypA/HybF